jgi:hypothetical protein
MPWIMILPSPRLLQSRGHLAAAFYYDAIRDSRKRSTYGQIMPGVLHPRRAHATLRVRQSC